MNYEKQKFLEHKAYNLRKNSILLPSYAGSGHPTTCLSAADIVATLFFDIMRYDPDNFENPNNDRFILSKGHASALLYAVWHELGKITDAQMKTYRDINSSLEGHPTLRFKYTEAATGALGIGLSIGLGEALNAKLDARDYYTYVLLGDGELAEGAIWEAAELAAYYKVDNLIAIADINRLGQTGATMYGYHVQKYVDKFEAFGWQTFLADGHNVVDMAQVLTQAKEVTGKPSIIIAKTIKGRGVDFAQDENGYHGKPFLQDELQRALHELEHNYQVAATYTNDIAWQPHMPKQEKPLEQKKAAKMPTPSYRIEEKIPTRKAYGQALAVLGTVNQNVVSLDGDVKNSTYAELFEAVHPKRFIECFIAEQNMVGMGIGFARRGKLPFISTFGAFMTRAHDQIRMAAIGQSTIKLIGSHAGISIGQDGPSQMGLEDIAMMRALPDSIVLYPSDAVSTYKLLEQMANYNDGISYMRTTRMATPVHYRNDEEFPIGGCKIVRVSQKDQACVIAAGVTLVEALKAYEILQQQNINICVIDLYSIKPLDTETVFRLGQASNNYIITVEDHYIQGGIGEAIAAAMCNTSIEVTSLAVSELPRSGKPEDLLSWAGIDAQSIVKAVMY
ncbi:MAG TPA: transketolase [Candidatus Dependentiae bacterium]|nr:transketolase [Candidatus Dependentiae bacterium]HRQ62811.1 transketolase [Candidatus Dependentiae bacterium]